MARRENLQRLVAVARMYYEEELTQAAIAARLGVSRPMVSKLLSEAKKCGVVKIEIADYAAAEQALARRMQEKFSLREALVVKNGPDEDSTNQAIALQALDWLAARLGAGAHLGVGWGSMVGRLVDCAEARPEGLGWTGTVCPLLGGAAASYRSYHTNELVRALAAKSRLRPAYLYAPAVLETAAQRDFYARAEAFSEIAALWGQLDLALINLSNYPSSPDMATAARFGGRLQEAGAAGHFLSYYFNEAGAIIHSDTDYVLHIGLAQLKRTPVVLALCGASVKTRALVGALRTGLVTHLALDEAAATAALHFA